MILEPNFYESRETKILSQAANRRVLHLGCVGHTDLPLERKIELAGETLHAGLEKVCKSVLGVDLDRQAIEGLKAAGTFSNLVIGDACKLDPDQIGDGWELIVVGDLIEHVSNPGGLLDSIRSVMNSETRLLITTPNSFSLPATIRHAIGAFREGNEHVLSFNYINIQQLLDRHGFETESVGTCYQHLARSSAFFNIGKAVFGIFPRFGGTLFITAKPRV
jgi:2-polyprenyl-3-methyl-5-hydroxy-6-metoxy-1,4-benzoquinol methylase